MELKVPCPHCGRTNWPPATASGEARPCVFCGLPVLVVEASLPRRPRPDYVLHMPPLPPLAWEAVRWVAEVEIPGYPAPEPVRLTVEVKYDPAVTDPTVSKRPSRQQVAAWVGIVANGPAIRSAVVACLEHALGEHPIDGEDPAVVVAECELSAVHLLTMHRDGLGYVGYAFNSFDYEHGLGVVAHGGRAVRAVGNVELSQTGLVGPAKADARRPRGNPRP